MDTLPDDIANFEKRIILEIGKLVKVELEGIELPLQSTVIGLEANHYLIIKAPEPLVRIEHKLFKGNDLIIRYIASGTVYAFQTKILEIISKPRTLLFLEYPRIIQHHDLRVQQRLPCHIPVEVTLSNGENRGCILDLAVNGCRCLITAAKNPAGLLPCELGNKVALKCIIPGSKEMTTLTGKIKNLKRTREELDFGINFDPKLPGETKRLLAWFLSTIGGLPFP